jgi:hypothetical protein
MDTVDRHPLEADTSFDGGATFANNPVAVAGVAEDRFHALASAAARLRRG